MSEFTVFTVIQINEGIDDSSDWAEPFINSYRSFYSATLAVREVVDVLIMDCELPAQKLEWFSTGEKQQKVEILTHFGGELIFSFIIQETTVED